MKYFFLTIILFVSVSFAVCTQGTYNISKTADVAGLPNPPINGHYCCLTSCTEYYCPNQQLCSEASFCDQNNFYYWNSFSGGAYYTQCDGCLTQQASATCNSGVSLNYSGGITLKCNYKCSTLDEALQKDCELSGGSWEVNPTTGQYECKSNLCDSTMICQSYSRSRCVDVPSGTSVTCYNGQCSGLPYSMWWSEYRTECSNECGQSTINSVVGDTAVTFGVSCDDNEEQCSSKNYCTEIDGNYIIFQKCLIGREVVGNVETRQTVPYIVRSGPGTCLENGYNSEKYEHSSGGPFSGSGSPPETQSDDCLIYGVGCSDDYKDTINYNEQNNKNPTNNCYCKPFDSMNSISQIVCPDGSVSIVYMSCADWENMFRSSSGGGGVSSSTPAPQSSTSNPNTSDSFGQYPNLPVDQGSTNRNVQGVLAGLSEYIINIKNTLLSIKDYLMNDNTSISVDTMPVYPHGQYAIDSTSFTMDSLYSILDTTRRVIDTSTKVSSGTCPILTGNFSQACKKFVPFMNKSDLNMRIDLNNISGFSLCTLFKSIVLGFASVVSFFIGFSIFGNKGL